MKLVLTTDMVKGPGGNIEVLPREAASGFPSSIDKYLLEELEVPASNTQDTAKRVHKYNNKTGYLSDNTYVKASRGEGKIGTRLEGYIDASARYGEYVIKGHGKWSPDPFIEKAFESNSQSIDRAIDFALNKAADSLIRGK